MSDDFLMFWKYMYIKYGKNIPCAANWTPDEAKKYDNAWKLRKWYDYTNQSTPFTYSKMKDNGYIIDKGMEKQIYELTDTFIDRFL